MVLDIMDWFMKAIIQTQCCWNVTNHEEIANHSMVLEIMDWYMKAIIQTCDDMRYAYKVIKTNVGPVISMKNSFVQNLRSYNHGIEMLCLRVDICSTEHRKNVVKSCDTKRRHNCFVKTTRDQLLRPYGVW